MKNNAMINIKSMRDNDENDVIELISEGGFYEKNGNWYIFYDEKQEMGMANCSVMIKINEEETVVTRKGDFYSKMIYRTGEKNEFLYNTPYGAMPMLMRTHKNSHDFNEKGGVLELEYSIIFQDENSKNKLTVTVNA